MKKENTQKLVELVKRLVQKEVNLAVQDMGKVMSKIIKEQVQKELDKHPIITEYDTVGRVRKNGQKIRDDFNSRVNYGYTLSQAANTIDPDTTRYQPKPVVTGNKVLNDIFSQVAEDMPDDFGSDMSNMLTENKNPYGMNNFNQNPNNMNPAPQQPPIRFELPNTGPDSEVINPESVPSSILNAMIKDYRPQIAKTDKIIKEGIDPMKRSNLGLDSNLKEYSNSYIPE